MNDDIENEDETRTAMAAFVREVFGSGERAPSDITHADDTGLTLETLRAQNDAAGSWRLVSVPGEIILDTDGIPAYAAPAEDVPTHIGGPVITQAGADRLGVDPADFPNVTIVPNYRKRKP